MLRLLHCLWTLRPGRLVLLYKVTTACNGGQELVEDRRAFKPVESGKVSEVSLTGAAGLKNVSEMSLTIAYYTIGAMVTTTLPSLAKTLSLHCQLLLQV